MKYSLKLARELNPYISDKESNEKLHFVIAISKKYLVDNIPNVSCCPFHAMIFLLVIVKHIALLFPSYHESRLRASL